MTLQDHHLSREDLKNRKDLLQIILKPTQDTEAQLLMQQQQELNLTKQKSPSKDTEGHDALITPLETNHPPGI